MSRAQSEFRTYGLQSLDFAGRLGRFVEFDVSWVL